MRYQRCWNEVVGQISIVINTKPVTTHISAMASFILPNDIQLALARMLSMYSTLKAGSPQKNPPTVTEQ